jgi:DNA-binding NarL/FixJ family response regulator
MLVDDSPDQLQMMVDAFTQAGFATITAVSGDIALDLLRRTLPDLVVLDAVMPGLDGFETCRLIKAEAGLAHLPVIFMTGLKDLEDVLRGLEAGGVDYVTKPVNLPELLARVRIHIANGRMAYGARAALDVTGRHLLATDAQGLIRWSTPQAIGLLAAWFPTAEVVRVRLPESVTTLIAMMIRSDEINRLWPISTGAGGGAAIAYLGRNGVDEYLFRLSSAADGSDIDRLRERLGLTQREAEILLWISRAKSNREISEILAISPRTVNKHLERIFAKLGIENRAAATSVTLTTLAAM